MAKAQSDTQRAILRMALSGYEIERDRVEDSIRTIQAQLKGKRISILGAVDGKPGAPKRVLSAAARHRIALAQKKRWAEHRRRKAEQAKAAKQG
ncbi:MAG TPA: hypothetical protein VGS58_05155 [Candidatus Sulfopaludibacter sp.]|nr:hypothetical protein [Candidatus Sulfopaludibacter sp.]